MKNSTFGSIPDSERSEQLSGPFLRLLRHSDPRDLADSPSLSMTVERFKRRFAQRLTNNLYVAESIIYSALREDGYSDAAARAEVARFAHDITRVVKAFAQEADTNTAVAEEIGQAQDEIGLAKITPVQTKGIA